MSWTSSRRRLVSRNGHRLESWVERKHVAVVTTGRHAGAAGYWVPGFVCPLNIGRHEGSSSSDPADVWHSRPAELLILLFRNSYFFAAAQPSLTTAICPEVFTIQGTEHLFDNYTTVGAILRRLIEDGKTNEGSPGVTGRIGVSGNHPFPPRLARSPKNRGIVKPWSESG